MLLSQNEVLAVVELSYYFYLCQLERADLNRVCFAVSEVTGVKLQHCTSVFLTVSARLQVRPLPLSGLTVRPATGSTLVLRVPIGIGDLLPPCGPNVRFIPSFIM